MKKYIPILLLSGCCNVPVVPDFPEAPSLLNEPCSNLTLIQNNAQLTDVLNSVVDNYALYHECKLKVDLWIEWYSQTKKIYEDIK